MALLTLNNFRLGLNTKQAPQLLPLEAAQTLTNATVENGHVVSLKGLATVAEPSHNFATNRSVATWFDKDYWTVNSVTSNTYDSELGYVGITPPTLGSFAAALEVSPTTGDLFGEYRYCVTFETADGWESAPNLAGTADYFVGVNAQTEKYDSAAWSIGTANPTYKVGDRVVNNDRLFECIAPHFATNSSSAITFNSGGTYEVQLGDTITGASSGATATVVGISLYFGGTWAAGTASGVLFIDDVTGTFTTENLDVGANLNVATVTLFYNENYPWPDNEPGVGEASGQYWEYVDNLFGGVDQIDLTGIPVSGSGDVSKRHIYRTTADGSEFYRIGTINDNTTTTYSDTLLDVDALLKPPLQTLDWLPPPDGGRYLLENDGVFWVGVGSKLYFSQQSNPHAWQPLDFIGFDAPVTAIEREFHGILVTTANRCFRVTGSTAETVAKQDIPAKQGCPNWRTMSQVGNAPIWYSNDGVCIWDGSNVQIVTKDVYRFDFTPVHAEVANDRYYLFGASKALVIDFRSGAVLNELNITCDLAWYDADTDVFYWKTGSTVYSYGAGSDLTFTYKSGWLGQETTVLKHARRVWVDSDSPVTLTFIGDGTTVSTNAFTSGGRNRAFLPPGTRNRYAELQVTGTGTLREIKVEYEALNP